MHRDEQIQVSRSFYEFIDDAAFEELFTLVADTIVNVRPHGQPKLEGINEFKEFYRSGRPFKDVTHELEQIIADDNIVAMQGTFSGTHIDTEETIEFPFADFHEYNSEGQITTRWTYFSHEGMSPK